VGGVRTLVVSDLHLGKLESTDLLRREDLRAPLLECLETADRCVILGDGLELREAPHRTVADVAAPFFAAVGQALGRDGELLLLAGNHDHGLAGGWIDGRLQTEEAGFLGLEQRYPAAHSGPLAERLAEAARPARLELAYPGVWLRDDVYAVHGHYADVHATVPTFERLAVGAMARYVVPLPGDGAAPDDYEAVLAPLYAWMHALTQRSGQTMISRGAGASARTWTAMTQAGRHRRPVRTLALRGGYAAVVAALNGLGLGPLQRDLSPTALRRGYLHGCQEVVRRLALDGPGHVLWGHSHRAGPWPGDDPAEWTAPRGARIMNAGSWVYQPHFLSPEPNGSPYWPGTAILVDDDGPPRLLRLLGDRGHDVLKPRRA
jgi:hypothetical protein